MLMHWSPPTKTSKKEGDDKFQVENYWKNLFIGIKSKQSPEKVFHLSLDSNIESKSSNNTYLNIIEIFKKLFYFF